MIDPTADDADLVARARAGCLESFAAVVAVEPSLDDLPSFAELGDALAEGTAALAAEAVGLPRWNELVDAGRFVSDPRELVP